ncbi:MAG TPA: sugar ABC transporter permease [Gaiellaceae bacterium]|nr:sugar ABC transporter permease [Gaiellaceae bacterium]
MQGRSQHLAEIVAPARPTIVDAGEDVPSRALLDRVRDGRVSGWLFVLPALAAYAVFVLWPLVQTFKYSLYQWDGVLPAKWVGLANFRTVFTDHELLSILGHAFQLMIFFSAIPVLLGLAVATVIRRVASRRIGSVARAVLFLPQVVPLVAAGIAWSWLLSTDGVVNQFLSAVGLGGVTRAWLGDFGTALPAVGVIGAWVLLGLCTVLLSAGMAKIDQTLYEAAQIDGAGPVKEFLVITLPGLRQEIAVCVTVTVIAALSAFDIVYISTRGGPGTQTMVPGLEIYQLAFFNRQVGLASALAVVLMLLVLACILPIQWLARRGADE